MISFDTLVSHGFGSAHVFVDPRSGLRSVIAIHNTRHGAAIGGSRFVSYLSDEAAWLDAIRLARGMAYKAAVAGLPLGGGKAVIMKPAGDFNREALFEAFGRAVDSLGGAYVTCEDSGTGTADMDTVRRVTRHALGSTAGSGDPSPLTAFGVRRGIEAAVAAKLGRDSVDGIHVAIQGVGHVGYYLAKELVERGARLTVADVNAENLDRAVRELGATAVSPEAIHAVACDVFAPCALGAPVNDITLPQLNCAIVAGAANNVLAEPRHGQALADRGILYAPDYAINSGGLINVAFEYRPEGYNAAEVQAKVSAVYETMATIFERSASTGRLPHEVADAMAEERIYG